LGGGEYQQQVLKLKYKTNYDNDQLKNN